jgi:hypothetical protein
MPRRIYWTNVSINTKVVAGIWRVVRFARSHSATSDPQGSGFRCLGRLASDQSELRVTERPVGADSREPRSISKVAKA